MEEKNFDIEILKKQLFEIEKRINEDKEILENEKDIQLKNLAREEIEELKKQKETIQKILTQKKPSEVIIEIRAGTGGQEASLFAADLFRMYLKYINLKNWKIKILDSHESELGGIKQIVFQVSGLGVYEALRYEGGVHRVQRIPKTEKSGRIHTSTASVAVLLKPKPKEIKINPQDLEIDFFRASGPGGQYVNRRETAVRIRHLPTGIVVTSQVERNQLENRKNALSLLEAKLYELQEKEKQEKIDQKRKSQIKWARRSDKIRTYNFVQNRVTDHRIKKSWNNLDEIIEGKLDPLIQALQKSS